MPHLRSASRLLVVAFLALAALLIATAQAGAVSFSNATPIALPGGSGTLGNAERVPVADRRVRHDRHGAEGDRDLQGIRPPVPDRHRLPAVGPAGQSAILMSDAGDCDNEAPPRRPWI